MKITPSARILRMLGEIAFDEWQCIAELVDNAFDDFSEIQARGTPWAGGFKVSVTLPKMGTRARDAEVIVRDTGSGMSLERLEHAVRAGWSSNDSFDKLGLFGMGFNVSTARLGRKTRVLTTRAGDAEWIGVEIDLDSIGDDFEAPDIRESKVNPEEHGTRIEISRLDADRADWLQRNAAALRRQLGQVYGWLLDNQDYELWVSGMRVKPRRLCRWGDERSIKFGNKGEVIPAYMEVDQAYAPAETCLACGNWQVLGLGVCEQCESTDLRKRDRRIHGWLGVQRYLDRTDYGVDFLRNGRKILINDKRIFEWSNPNDPTAATLVEYPTELGQGGRLIGEIHLDHVPVDYKKNAFEYSDKQWKQAVSYLRGAGPLLPQRAREAGYEENDSFLGRLVKGYRRNTPGTRYLVPGDGSGPIHDQTRAWAQKFFDGDPDYQSDEKWWNAVLAHESIQAAGTQKKAGDLAGDSPDELSLLTALGVSVSSLNKGQGDAPQAAPAEPAPETDFNRAARYRQHGDALPSLSGDLGHPDLGHLKVESFLVADALVDSAGHRSPVWLLPGAGGAATAFVDRDHTAFTRFGWTYAEAVLVELSALLRLRLDSNYSLTQAASLVQQASLPDTALDVATVASMARDVFSDVRVRMEAQVEPDPARAWQYVGTDEVAATENAMIASGVRGTGPLGEDASFVRYAPPLYLVRLLEEWPEAFMDGAAFKGPFASVDSPSARRLAVSRVVSLLSDVAAFVITPSPTPLQVQRTRLSVLLLEEEIVAEA